MNQQRLSLAALALASAGLLAACGNGVTTSHTGSGPVVDTSPSASPTPTPTPSPSASASSSPSAATSSKSSTPEPAKTPVCGVADLDISIGDQSGAAGSTYSVLTFRNTSRATCTLDGHPGVSFVGKHNGTQIGKPAVRTGSLKLVTLAPGESTNALLQIADAGNYPASCAPTTVDGLRVYPPDSYTSEFVALKTQACQGSTGGSPQMSVSAVGHTG